MLHRVLVCYDRGMQRDLPATHPQFSSTVAAPRIELLVEREANVEVSRTVVLDGDGLRIGVHPSNDLVLDDPKVSRFHCRLSRQNGAWRLTDTGSLNGVRINGVTVRDADLSMPESFVELGDSRFRARELVAEGKIPVLVRASFGGLYGKSLAMRKLFAVLERVAQSEVNVLVEGESGTGKELVATEIVRRGPRANKPFVIVDCGAMSPSLIESQLFGHARGAFTGADRERPGAFEVASGGTVFLDEVGELPIDMQPKLLRVLESREVCRLGETKTRPVDVRVVAATNRELEREMNQRRFREDLYFRLAVVTVRVPPLRAHLEDIPLLVPVLLESLGVGTSSSLFTPTVIEEMSHYEWPGNVRELRNYIERTAVLQSTTPMKRATDSDEEALDTLPVDIEIPFRTAKEQVIASFERSYVTALLLGAQGNVSLAARKAGMDRMNLHRLIGRYAIRSASPFRDPA